MSENRLGEISIRDYLVDFTKLVPIYVTGLVKARMLLNRNKRFVLYTVKTENVLKFLLLVRCPIINNSIQKTDSHHVWRVFLSGSKGITAHATHILVCM